MIKIRELYKSFDGFPVLKGLDMTIKDGAVYGFVGPNGAGKTTTMRIMAGLLKADSGEIVIEHSEEKEKAGGIKSRKSIYVRGDHIASDYKAHIGYMPDFFGVYDRLKVKEYMEFFASIYGLEGDNSVKEINELLELVNLCSKKEVYVDTLSRGMKQKLCLARCMIHNPKLLILDEPASGLDPRARFEFKEIIKNLGQRGHTILISSHILPDLAEMCTDIGIIDRGRCLMSGTVEEIEEHMLTMAPLVIQTAGKMEEAIVLLQNHPLVEHLSYNNAEIRVLFKGVRGQEVKLLRHLIEKNIPVHTFTRDSGNLEALFMEITSGGGMSNREHESYL